MFREKTTSKLPMKILQHPQILVD